MVNLSNKSVFLAILAVLSVFAGVIDATGVAGTSPSQHLPESPMRSSINSHASSSSNAHEDFTVRPHKTRILNPRTEGSSSESASDQCPKHVGSDMDSQTAQRFLKSTCYCGDRENVDAALKQLFKLRVDTRSVTADLLRSAFTDRSQECFAILDKMNVPRDRLLGYFRLSVLGENFGEELRFARTLPNRDSLYQMIGALFSLLDDPEYAPFFAQDDSEFYRQLGVYIDSTHPMQLSSELLEVVSRGGLTEQQFEKVYQPVLKKLNHFIMPFAARANFSSWLSKLASDKVRLSSLSCNYGLIATCENKNFAFGNALLSTNCEFVRDGSNEALFKGKGIFSKITDGSELALIFSMERKSLLSANWVLSSMQPPIKWSALQLAINMRDREMLELLLFYIQRQSFYPSILSSVIQVNLNANKNQNVDFLMETEGFRVIAGFHEKLSDRVRKWEQTRAAKHSFTNLLNENYEIPLAKEDRQESVVSMGFLDDFFKNDDEVDSPMHELKENEHADHHSSTR